MRLRSLSMGWLDRFFPAQERPPAPAEPTPPEIALAYHERTKHAPGRFARGPGGLDWENQPDPFRRWAGAETWPLERLPPIPDDASDPRYDRGLRPRAHRAGGARFALARRASSTTRFALSAWKELDGSRWALRVNPSSGNLHPTEGYAVLGPIAGLSERPRVVHYAPREHAARGARGARRGAAGPSSRASSAARRSWSGSPRSTGARPGSTASARTATASTTPATPWRRSRSPRPRSAGARGSSRRGARATSRACSGSSASRAPRRRSRTCSWP